MSVKDILRQAAELGTDLQTIAASALGVAQLLKPGEKVTVEEANRVSEILGELINTQTKYLALHQEVAKLAKHLEELENFDEELANYRMRPIPPKGNFVYVYEAEGTDTPLHYACTNCKRDRVISVLQPTGYANHGEQAFRCDRCSAVVTGYPLR